MADRGLAGRDGRGCRPPLARANGRIDDYRRALPEQRQGLLNREVSPFEIDSYHLVEALLCHVFEQQKLAVTCIYEDAVQVPELPLDRIVSRSGSLLTSARTARLSAPSVSLAACSDLSFKPQMATRAPSLSNSCAAASPIPLLPPVIRIFLSASLRMIVPPMMVSHLIRFGGSNTSAARIASKSRKSPNTTSAPNSWSRIDRASFRWASARTPV